MKNQILYGDNLEILKSFDSGIYNLIYIDPPFNTGRTQVRNDKELFYNDSYEDYINFLKPRLIEGYRVLKSNGSFFFHIDYRESHYCKILLDSIFGRESFMNEIIWSYDYGGRSKKKWSNKHDTIYWYVKNPKDYIFNYDSIDRIPYLSPSLVGKDKAERGKTPTDVWWNTIVHTNGKEKTGYPTQKPLSIINRIIRVHSNENDNILDFFAGSGTIGESCKLNNRFYTLIDQNQKSIEIMKRRLGC